MGAFEGCSSLQSINIPESVTRIEKNTFRDCEVLTNLVLPKNINFLGEESLAHCSALTSIVIPNAVTSIGKSAFSMCWSLNSVTLPQGLMTIEERAFYGCGLKNTLKVPYGVTTIGPRAFNSNMSLTAIELPQTLTTLGEGAFNDNRELTALSLPQSLTNIGGHAFANCKKITEIEILAKAAPTIAATAFKEIPATCKLYLREDATGYAETYGNLTPEKILKVSQLPFENDGYQTLFSDKKWVMPAGVRGGGVILKDNTTTATTSIYMPGDVVPANFALLLHSQNAQNGEFVETKLLKNKPTLAGNLLKGTLTETVVNAPNTKYFVLGKNAEGKVGFFWQDGTNGDQVTNPAGQCYLPLTASQLTNLDTKSLLFQSDLLTHLATLLPAFNEPSGAIYDLQGRRVQPSAKGVYIIHGKKVMQ